MQATAPADRILGGLDRAMAGQPRTLRIRCAASNGSAPLLATVEYLSGYPCPWVSCFDFCGEPTAALRHALRRCRQSGKVDEIECYLRHALEPGRSLVFDWLVDAGFVHILAGTPFVCQTT